MAIEKGIVSTTEIPTDALVLEIDDEIRQLDADESQFTTMTMASKVKETPREKFNWLEKEYFPRLVVVEGAVTNVATSVILEAGQGASVRVGDVLRNMALGDAVWVTAVAGDTLTVVRNIGVKAAQAWADANTLLITSNAAAQGADFGQTAVLMPTTGFNYTQIVRHGYTFSRTAAKAAHRGGAEPGSESAFKGVEHKRAIEYTGFWGARDMKTDPATGEPVGFTGGLVEFVTTNKQDVGGALTVDYIDTFMMDALQYSSRNVRIYASPLAAYQISRFNRSGQGSAWRPSKESVAGGKVDAFMSGVYGYEVPIVVKKDWNDFPTTLDQYGGWLFIVDHDSIWWRPFTGASTKLLSPRQNKGADRISEEYLTEGGWQIANQSHHSILYGIV